MGSCSLYKIVLQLLLLKYFISQLRLKFSYIFVKKYVKHMLKNHLQQIENGITYYSRTYENFIVKEDFNAEIFDTSIGCFCVIHNFKSLIKECTCYKNPDNPACIDLILTQSRGPVFKTTEWLQGRLSLSSFRGR